MATLRTRYILEDSLLLAFMAELLVTSLLDGLLNSLAIFYHLCLSLLSLKISRSRRSTFLDLFMP
jgi:hypothetical protein